MGGDRGDSSVVSATSCVCVKPSVLGVMILTCAIEPRAVPSSPSRRGADFLVEVLDEKARLGVFFDKATGPVNNWC